MSKAMDHGPAQVCPQCDRHCPIDALQCGRGRKYFDAGALPQGRHRHGGHPNRNDLAGKFEHCGRLLSHCLGKRRGQGRILHILYQRGEMSQQELQELLGVQAGSLSEIAAKLEDRGLITRVRSEQDRRKVYLSITEKGRDIAAQSGEEHILRRRAELFSALTPEEQNTLESLLDKLSADWAKHLERQGRGGQPDSGQE